MFFQKLVSILCKEVGGLGVLFPAQLAHMLAGWGEGRWLQYVPFLCLQYGSICLVIKLNLYSTWLSPKGLSGNKKMLELSTNQCYSSYLSLLGMKIVFVKNP